MPSNLLKTSYGYYFRLTVPADLRPALGRTEIKKSLKTCDKVLARRLAACYAAHAHQIFDAARRSMLIHDNKFTISGLEILPDGTLKVGAVSTDPSNPADAEQLSTFLQQQRQLLAAPELSKTQPVEAPLLSKLVSDYTQHKRDTKSWTDKTESENRAALQLLIDITGDLPVTAVTIDLARVVFQTLQKLPPNMRKNPRFRDLTVEQILAAKPKTTLNTTTVNKIIDRISSAWKYGASVLRLPIPGDLWSSFHLRASKAADKKRPALSDDEAAIVLNLPHSEPWQFWAAKIALYNGLRSNEIAQLHTADIYIDTETLIPVISVNDSGDKKVKTERSRRIVPVHPKLIELGLLSFVATVETVHLWPFPKGRDGHNKKLSRWYGQIRHQHGITERYKDFHALRHTFCNKLKSAQIDVYVAADLAGHESPPGMTYNVYGKRHSVKTMLEALKAVNYDREKR